MIVKEALPVATSAFPTAAVRPHNSRLDTTLLQATFGLKVPPWQDGVWTACWPKLSHQRHN